MSNDLRASSDQPQPIHVGENTPLLAAETDSSASPQPLPAPTQNPAQAYRPEYSLSSLVEAHSQSNRAVFFFWITEIALLVWLITILTTVLTHQAGVFTFHPIFQALAVFALYQGILILQPTDSPSSKRTGLLFHQAFQIFGTVSIIIGSSAILYNKILHSAPHFTSWHGLFGIITASLIILQAVFGALVGFEFSRDFILGDTFGRKLWKYHRASGYLIVALMTITILTATKSDWLLLVSNAFSIWVLRLSSLIAVVGLSSLINFRKIFRR
ncbi:hypothetical protein O181_066283 [Austropuccinia psidii MF-1]|uniref:Cytochrome b561 domain-containing protein n=1 Tax=Austropuccinia psidii MF-1 TaxID=1389203 RepID=A0A9Q3I3G2_9BASI|nr:hypothetical protein [Austropuccinia psidii MF-1]